MSMTSATMEDALPRQGARIVLRRLRPDDLAAFQAYRHDPVVGRYQGWQAQPDPAAHAFLEEMYRIKPLQHGTWTQLAIARREDDALIGDVGIRVDESGQEAEIGFTLGRAAQRQGLATEAVAAACALTFERTAARRILAVIDARNAAAIRLVERLGLRRIASEPATFRGEACVEHTYELPRPPSSDDSYAGAAEPAWAERRAAAVGRHAARYDAPEAQRYASTPGLGALGEAEVAAYLADIARVLEFSPGQAVLDVGAGSGAFCSVLARLPGLRLTALEPSPHLLERLRANPLLRDVTTVQGHADGPADGSRFDEGSFDVVACRQVVNGLFDPLAAFRHWQRWLKPGGAVLVVEGLYGRDAWPGAWAGEVDALPLAAVQSMATVPYLLEAVGYSITAVERMQAVNALPTTRTPRYVVVARR